MDILLCKVRPCRRSVRSTWSRDGTDPRRRAPLLRAVGYDGATVPRLERRSALHGAIFNYYSSKLDLFVALAREDHKRFHRLYDEIGFAGLARHIASADPAWLSVYLELHRRLYRTANSSAHGGRRWSTRRRTCTPTKSCSCTRFSTGLVFARATSVEIDVSRSSG